MLHVALNYFSLQIVLHVHAHCISCWAFLVRIDKNNYINDILILGKQVTYSCPCGKLL